MGTTSQKLSYLNGTKELLRTAISRTSNTIGDNDTFREYPEKLYSGYVAVLNNPSTLWNNMNHVQNEDSSFTLSNTVEAPMRVNFKGNCHQNDSANLLEIDPYQATQTLYGVTITYNNDGTITLNGTSTSWFQVYLPDLDETTHLQSILEPNTQYYLNGCPSGGSSNTYCLEIETESRGSTTFQDTGNGISFTNLDGTGAIVMLTISRNQTFSNALFKPMLVKGNEAQPFEPYGKPASPTSPKTIHHTKGTNTVILSNHSYSLDLIPENSFNKDDYEVVEAWMNVSTKVLTGSTANKTVWVPVKPNKTYLVTKIIGEPSSAARFRIGTSVNIPAVNVHLTEAVQDDEATTLTITTGSTDKYLSVFCWNNNLTTSFNDIVNSIEIREVNPVFAELNNGDTIFKASVEDMYYNSLTQAQKNQLTADSWYVARYTKTVVLNPNWTWSQASSPNTDVYYTEDVTDYILGDNVPLCEYFKGVDMISNISDMATKENNTFALVDDKVSPKICFKTSDLTFDEFKTWIGNTDVTVYYKSAVVFLLIDDSALINRLEELSHVKSVTGNTMISQMNEDLPFIVHAKAIR